MKSECHESARREPSNSDLSCSPGVSLLVAVNPRFGIGFGLQAEDGLPDSIAADDQDVITEAVPAGKMVCVFMLGSNIKRGHL